MHRTLMAAAILAALSMPAGADTRSGDPAAHKSEIHLDWAEMPNADDLIRVYPPEARERGVSGDTRIQCTVEPDGTLVDCDVLAETPQAMGFGAAAIEASHRFRMTPYKAALIHGQLPRVIIPMHWVVAPTPEKAAPPSSRVSPPTRMSATPQAAPKPFPGFFAVFPAVFPVVFIGMWLVITSILGLLSGWYGLMERYPDRREPALARIGFLSGMMGVGVSLRGILTLTACQSGLRVSIWRIFGPFSRPFFVPWREIATQPKTIFFSPMVRLSFGKPEVGVLSIGARAWERLAGSARQAVGSQAPPAYPVSEWRLIRTTLVQWVVITAFAASFYYFAPRLMSLQAQPLPLALCVGFPATFFGAALLVRYLGQRRRG